MEPKKFPIFIFPISLTPVQNHRQVTTLQSPGVFLCSAEIPVNIFRRQTAVLGRAERHSLGLTRNVGKESSHPPFPFQRPLPWLSHRLVSVLCPKETRGKSLCAKGGNVAQHSKCHNALTDLRGLFCFPFPSHFTRVHFPKLPRSLSTGS